MVPGQLSCREAGYSFAELGLAFPGGQRGEGVPMAESATNSSGDHLPYLDGLRGTAAAWVFLHHVGVLNAIHYPVIMEGPSAVDLFMLLSGFLMTFHYLAREAREPWTEPDTWFRFWLRRF